MRKIRIPLRGTLFLIVLGGLGLAIWNLRGHTSESGSPVNPGSRFETSLPTVKTIHPKQDANFRIANEQIATVEAYYQAGLRTRLAGIVKSVSKDIGALVREGELLVEIDAPDLQQEVLQKAAVVDQRRKEWKMSEELFKHSTTALEVAKKTVVQRKAEVVQAEAIRDFRLSRFNRVHELAKRESITPDAEDESKREYQSAEAGVSVARIAVEKAELDILDRQSLLDAAAAELELKKALIVVAEKDYQKAQALAGYAQIRAPFDGVITKRNVDPGMFVQNASTGNSESLLTVARVDLVTITVKLPDNAAAFITKDTEAEVQLSDLPGFRIRGKITRFSPTIDPMDRTMRIEMDVFNGTESQYQSTIKNVIASAGLASTWHSGLEALSGSIFIEQMLFQRKQGSDGIPICPLGTDLAKSGRRLTPGMTGNMKVFLEDFHRASLLPSSAVYNRGGKTYILIVDGGITKQLPVVVQVNDGTIVKIGVLKKSPSTNSEVIEELTGNEEIVLARQAEIGEGARVQTSLTSW